MITIYQRFLLRNLKQTGYSKYDHNKRLTTLSEKQLLKAALNILKIRKIHKRLITDDCKSGSNE
jgi:hypothetical protein